MFTDKQPFTCPHDHDFLPDSHHANERRTWFVIILTFTTMVVEIISGILFGSMALLADGWHMASHASAMGITAMAYYFIKKHKSNSNFSFGTGKIGDLAGYSSALLLAFIALFMAYESIHRLFEPRSIRFNEALIVAVIGLAVNVICAFILKEDSEHHHHEHDHDHNLRAAYLHVLADALTSILAIVALFFGKTLGWTFLDPVMGIAGALMISRWSVGLLKETGKALLDHNSDNRMLQDIRETVESIGGAASVEDLHLWRLGQGHYSAIISIRSHTEAVPEDYKTALCRFHWLSHVTVEINKTEPISTVSCCSSGEN